MLNKVKIKNTANGATMEYTIVGESEANFREGKLAVGTPIAKALLGHKKGDVVDVQVPSGLIKFEIIDYSRRYFGKLYKTILFFRNIAKF